MRTTALLLFFLFRIVCANAQENRTIIFNPLRETTEDMMSNLYQFKEFVDGRIILKEGLPIIAKMNYHRVYGQVLFIGPKKDTLTFGKPELLSSLVIGTDTFFYHDKKYIRKHTHYASGNLYQRQTLKFIGLEKPGPYGTYSAVSSANTNRTFSTDNQITQYLQLDENQIYKFNNEFYFSNDGINFFVASKRNLFLLFPSHKIKIRDFLDSHSIKFTNMSDLEELLKHIHSNK